MNDLDDLLSGAASRLAASTEHLVLPGAPNPSRPGLSIALGALAGVAALGAVAVGVSHRDGAEQRGELPPGFAEGDFGTEVVITELDDGDGNPATRLYEGDHGAGRIAVVTTDHVPNVKDGVTELSPADTEPVAPASSEATVPRTCYLATHAQLCLRPQDVVAETVFDDRSSDGQVFSVNVPDDVLAVTYRSGNVLLWTRPVGGLAVFPRNVGQADTMTIQFHDESGIVDTQEATAATASPEEIAAAVVTAATDSTLPHAWFLDVPPDGQTGTEVVRSGTEVVRTPGRTVLTGFRGPFAAQSVRFVNDADQSTDAIWAVTVLSTDLADATKRLADVPGGSLRRTLVQDDGTTVLVWAADRISETGVDSMIAWLAPLEASAQADLQVAEPWSWAQDPNTYPYELGPLSPLRALLGETVGTDVLAIADDVGQYAFVLAHADYSSIAMAGGPFVDDNDSPLLQDQAYPGLWALDGTVSQVVLTTADGTTIEPELIDVSRYVNATLVLVPDGTEGVVDVRIERG